ncbi:hypothetical protein V8E51_001273 [Hyaloscypha variabilis]
MERESNTARFITDRVLNRSIITEYQTKSPMLIANIFILQFMIRLNIANHVNFGNTHQVSTLLDVVRGVAASSYSLAILDYSFVGLELPKPIDSEFKGAYHDFVKGAKYTKLDLTIASQSGHADEAVEDWAPTIKYD